MTAKKYSADARRWLETLRPACLMSLLLGCFLAGCSATPSTVKRAYVPGETLELDNGILRVHADLDYGGMITYLSLSGEERNLINNFDRGRQVQASYYAGQHLDRREEGQHPAWSSWNWNPIGAGDTYENSPEVVEASSDGDTIYVKTIPLLWDMNNEAAECVFETWITLDGNRVWVTNKLTSQRTDDRWEAIPYHQEIPAVYTIADLNRLYTYEGDAPFTGAPLRQIENQGPPWVYWGVDTPHEKWAATVDEDDWGVGVYSPDAELFVGGFHGASHGDTHAAATGYIAPLCTRTLDKDTVFEYRFCLIVDTLDEIRAFVYQEEDIQ